MKCDTAIIILAGGQGKRMCSTLPKVLVPLNGRPMIEYVFEAVRKSDICERPTVVVGFGAEQVKKVLGDKADYVYQVEQKGTGHAVAVCQPYLENNFKNIIVLYGDMPFITAETIEAINLAHESSGASLTMVTITVPDFEGWRSPFINFGRIERMKDGKIKSVEFKDCTEEQKKITELNPCIFCFKSEWLWENIKKLGKENAQGEYYLTCIETRRQN
jgi:bifunctional UDP-N-acetylglucosamine pyrophosphorylase / glucosamine-1-phosphate N-acetyltransferase